MINYFRNVWKNRKQISYLDITFVVIVIYISFINLFVLRSTPEILALQFALLIVIFQKVRINDFAKFWVPFLGLFFIYEFLRGFADDVSPFYNLTLYKVYEWELGIFGTLPTITLQQLVPNSSWLLNLLVFFYTIFFYYSFFVAFLLWFKKSKQFPSYVQRFLTLSFLGLLFFFFIPTAPPWMVAENFGLNLERYLYTKDTILGNFIGVTFWNYFIYGNKVAALPSLHTAWPAFTSHFVIRHFKFKSRYSLLIFPTMIGMCVILTGEHYVIDVVFGWALALVAVYLPEKYYNVSYWQKVFKKG